MTDAELLKEFIRDAYNSAALDLGVDQKFLEGSVRIFAGEMEAILAVQNATYLEADDQRKLLDMASLTPESAKHYVAWRDRI